MGKLKKNLRHCMIVFLANRSILMIAGLTVRVQPTPVGPAYGENCYEFVEELENDMTYNEAKDHCENLNGTLINENRILDVEEV